MSGGGVTLRRFSPADAASVSACARAVYGADYAIRDIYDPAAVARHNEEGTWVSFVAVDGASSVIAHLALELSPDGPVAETGMGMVVAEHRRTRILERLRDAVVEEARRRGLGGYFFEIGTENLAIQRMSAQSDVTPCGITLGVWPRPNGGGRLSFIRGFRYLERPARVIGYLPPAHEAILHRIYEALRVPLEARAAEAPSGPTTLVRRRHPEWQTIFLTATELGGGAAVEEACRAVVADRDIESAYLELPLASPAAPLACAQAESVGFFFAGVTPYGSRAGDALRLQWRRRDAASGEAEILLPFARELYDYVIACAPAATT